ncbi:hypothetical protein [Flavobacterium kingsejongi]|uniref:Uncharacterized protein n=1 Tax=Flavobacterium kingsejongi TaxID=1678728 RepID=A0A2S1LLN4_9FLAO|nr:hypothetical protein [Flavobacterium kingsejongi]AWG24581.1 hypothetical protein FK004_04735 [Flavobacterium kingsejongi]
MALTPENIQQIDNYLIRLGIGYYDIRLEMTDHIACDLRAEERNFDLAFRAYCECHKKELIRLNAKLGSHASQKAIALIFKQLRSPLFIFLGLLFFSVSFLYRDYFSNFDFEWIDGHRIIQGIAGILIGCSYLYKTFLKKLNFSVSDKIAAFYCVFVTMAIMVNVNNHIDTTIGRALYTSFMSSFAIVMYSTYRTSFKHYTLKLS